ncbi:MAG: hypothetical protein ACSLE1_03140 [Sphingobium sp.]
MSAWKLLADEFPDVKQEVLLHWPVPDMKPIIRLGSMLYKPFGDDCPIWKFDLDYGDAGAWVFTNRGDEQPSHWMAISLPDVSRAVGRGEV